MALEYDLTRSDYADLVFAASDRWRIRRWQWLLLAVVLGVLALLVGAITTVTGDHAWVDEIPLFRPLAYVIGVLLGLMALLAVLRAGLRALVGHVPAGPGCTPGRHRVELIDTGAHDRSAAGEHVVAWADVTEVRDAPATVGLLQGRVPQLVIPKRAFASAAAVAAFVQGLRARLPGAASGPVP